MKYPFDAVARYALVVWKDRVVDGVCCVPIPDARIAVSEGRAFLVACEFPLQVACAQPDGDPGGD